MSARAMWKGVIRAADLAIPVKLYAAANDKSVHFHLLHAPDHSRVHQKMIHPGTEEEVPREAIRKGYALAAGVFVLLTPEELEAVAPKPSRDIEVLRFLPETALDRAWYDRPYFLGPDALGEPYWAMQQALLQKKRIGIVRWVMRGHYYFGALHATPQALTLLSLHDKDEVIEARALQAPEGRAVDERELALAEQLVSALQSDFDPQAFHDEYRERVLQLIADKARGVVRKPAPAPRAQPAAPALTSALQASLKAVRKVDKAGKREHAERAHKERRSA